MKFNENEKKKKKTYSDVFIQYKRNYKINNICMYFKIYIVKYNSMIELLKIKKKKKEEKRKISHKNQKYGKMF